MTFCISLLLLSFLLCTFGYIYIYIYIDRYIYIYTFYLLISCAGIAFSELIDIIEKVLLASTEPTPVFMMNNLRLIYQRILKKLGGFEDHISCVNGTRLKEKILAECPQL